MEFISRKLDGVLEILLKPISDERGFFMRTFDEKLFKGKGLNINWVQENHSRSNNEGILRGLHFQLPPFSETKLVRCIQGKILDVFVDLRQGSTTFGQWDSIELSAENKKMIIIPRGFAHGFLTLTEVSEVVYKVDNYYSNKHERGLIWNDPDIQINWPTQNPTLSMKDRNNMSFDHFIKEYNSISI